jgi:hypothetical protein
LALREIRAPSYGGLREDEMGSVASWKGNRLVGDPRDFRRDGDLTSRAEGCRGRRWQRESEQTPPLRTKLSYKSAGRHRHQCSPSASRRTRSIRPSRPVSELGRLQRSSQTAQGTETDATLGASRAGVTQLAECLLPKQRALSATAPLSELSPDERNGPIRSSRDPIAPWIHRADSAISPIVVAWAGDALVTGRQSELHDARVSRQRTDHHGRIGWGFGGPGSSNRS